MDIQDYLNQPFMYGGESWPLGRIIKDLEAKAMNPRAISCYVRGLMQNKEITGRTTGDWKK